jgi:DNA (cytosine-5)-methyltransferase 1
VSKPRLLDLFCGAGGAARGYQLAGFHVTGIDNRPQPRYAGDVFIQADALEYVAAHGHDFDAIHASPPCQAFTVARNIRKRQHPDLISPLRPLLVASGVPWVIENVYGSPLVWPRRLCGTSFGLRVEYRGTKYELRRHRYFEGGIPLGLTPPCDHRLPVIGIYGHGESKAMRSKRGFQISHVEQRRQIMEMSWANRDEIAEAVPPAYTEFIGKQLIQHLQASA